MDYRDIIGGLLLLAAGIFIVWHALNTLNLGNFQQPGPGAFPTSVGVILSGFGVALIVPACFRAGTLDSIEWRSLIGVMGGIAMFAMTIRPFGLIPAIIALIIVSSLAERRFRPVSLLAMCIVLPLTAYLTFRVGLSLPMAMFRWPF